MRKTITVAVLITLVMGFSFLVSPALAQEAASPQPGNAATIQSSGSTMSSSMNSTPSMNSGGYQTSIPSGQSVNQSGTFAYSTPSGQTPLGGRDMCMGGAGGTESGSAASGMGSC